MHVAFVVKLNAHDVAGLGDLFEQLGDVPVGGLQGLLGALDEPGSRALLERRVRWAHDFLLPACRVDRSPYNCRRILKGS